MTNGIAIGALNKHGLAFDYWEDIKCTSGYQHGTNSLNLLFRDYFKGKLSQSMWTKWSPKFTLAVPEQLVWWKDE